MRVTRCWVGLIFVVGCGSQPSDTSGDAPASSPDAAVDAAGNPPLDAIPDAPPVPAGPFHVTPLAGPIHRSVFRPAAPIEVIATNDSAAPLALTAVVTGPFVVENNSCSAIGPGGSCTLQVVSTAHAFGTYDGSLALTGAGTTVTVPIEVVDEAFVGAAASDGGSVTVDPPEDGCSGCYPSGTVVTITATPAPGFLFTGWTDADGLAHVCAQNPCTVMAGATSTWNQANFVQAPHTLQIDFIGNGPGTVYVYESLALGIPLATCSASCTVAIDLPTSETFQVAPATKVDFHGFGAPCGSASTCTLPVTTTHLTVDFSKQPGEQDIEVDGGVIGAQSVDFDPANELVVGGVAIHVFTAALAPKWTAPFNGVARFAPNGDVLVRTSTQLVKLAAADGHVLWQHPVAGSTFDLWGLAHELATTPAGGAVVGHGDSVEVWSPDGSSTFVIPVDGHRSGSVTTGADGRIYVGVQYGVTSSVVEVFSPLGVRELPDFGPRGGGDGIEDETPPTSIAVGTTKLVVTEKAEGDEWVGFQQFAPDRTFLGENIYTEIGEPELFPPHVVAMNASEQIAFACHPDVRTTLNCGLLLIKYDTAGHELWRVERDPHLGDQSGPDDGIALTDVAIAPDGRVAVLDDYSLVEVFAP